MAKKATTATKSTTKVVPLGDRVLLRRETAESTTAGGIVLPDSAKDKPQRGVRLIPSSHVGIHVERGNGLQFLRPRGAKKK